MNEFWTIQNCKIKVLVWIEKGNSKEGKFCKLYKVTKLKYLFGLRKEIKKKDFYIIYFCWIDRGGRVDNIIFMKLVYHIFVR